jgi:hypothetical protein
MNTENLNVKQLSHCESANINGGGILLWAVRLFVGGLILEVAADGWAQCKADFLEGYNQSN